MGRYTIITSISDVLYDGLVLLGLLPLDKETSTAPIELDGFRFDSLT